MQLGVLEYLISVNDKGVGEGISKSEKKLKSGAAKAEKALKDTGSRMSAWTVAKGQMIAKYAEKAISTISNIGKNMVKTAISSYAEREQLVGGVETLFKTASDKVLKNAEKAFETAGISANEYMQTVTSFSASLLQSLGGDTSRAADVADMALQDMADNANKMGTEMSAIQNAYQGFAKQNYTMLDNLKLGYGGTKSEMERLLKDATALTGVKYDIQNLSDVYEAIHAIQNEMGITGTTAKEARETISGSLGMLKASWKDLLTTIADPNGDVGKAMDTVSANVKTFLKNIKPVFKRTIKALIGLVKDALPEVWSILKTDILPAAKSLAKDILKGITDAISSGKLFDALFKKVIPKLINTIKTKVVPALAKVTENLSSSLKASENPFVRSIGNIVDGLSLFLDENGNFTLPSLGELWGKIEPALTELWDGVKGLATNILRLAFGTDAEGGIDWPTPGEWGEIVEAKLGELWGFVRSVAESGLKLVFGEDENGGIEWPDASEWATLVENIILGLWDTVKGAASSLLRLVFGEDEEGGIDWPDTGEWLTILQKGLEDAWGAVKGALSGVLKIVFGESPDGGIEFPSPQDMWNMVQEKFTEFWEGFKQFLIGAAVWSIGNIDLSWLSNPEAVWNTIKDTFSKYWDKIVPFIVSGAAWPIGMIVFGAAKDAWEAIKEKFAEWWGDLSKEISEAASWLIGDVLFPAATAVVKEIQEWWEKEVKPKLNLVISPVLKLRNSLLGYDPDKEYGEYTGPSVKWGEWSFGQPEGNAKGNWSVPYDNFPALLHRDEMVLTKSQARQYREGNIGGGGGVDGTMVAAAVEAAMSRVYVMMSGEKVGDLTTRRIKKNLNASSYARMRALGG